MDRRTKKGRPDCIILSGPVYASSPTGVRALLSVYIYIYTYMLPERLHRVFFSNRNDYVIPEHAGDSWLELVGV